MLNIIVAMDKNGLIGRGNTLPWNIPEDMKYFKETTMGHIVVMGRNTYESIPKELKGRECFILTRNENYEIEWGTKIYSIENFIPWTKKFEEFNKDTFIIGGAQIYKKIYPYCDKLFITYVNDIYEGDIYFPIELSKINEDFEIESKVKGKKCEFVVMKRKQ